MNTKENKRTQKDEQIHGVRKKERKKKERKKERKTTKQQRKNKKQKKRKWMETSNENSINKRNVLMWGQRPFDTVHNEQL